MFRKGTLLDVVFIRVDHLPQLLCDSVKAGAMGEIVDFYCPKTFSCTPPPEHTRSLDGHGSLSGISSHLQAPYSSTAALKSLGHHTCPSWGR